MEKSIRSFLVPVLIISLMACGYKVESQVVKGNSERSPDNKSPLKGAVIKNDIDIEASNVKVKAAYLMTEDAQYKENNIAKLNERVILTIALDTGWTKHNGITFLGASEQIFDKDGTVVLDAKDLFSNLDEKGLESKVAYNINLSAFIESIEPGYEEFTVKFRVWDKKGNGEVKGKYKFKIVE
jgi:hypothetical protein